MALRPEDAIRIEHKERDGNRQPRKTYIFKCSKDECNRETKVRSDDLNRHSSLCKWHSKCKRPFESIFNGILQDVRWRHIPVDLTYEEFLEFTKIPNCHYCMATINWQPYGTVEGQYTSRAYFLDRKDNAFGYSKDNCVVCCSWCNIFRRNLITYEEMKVAMAAITELRAHEKAPILV